MNEFFRKFARACTNVVGSPWAFVFATACIVAWFIFGLVNGFTDTVQLYVNTGTTISTGLIVFLIQNAQNRDSKALHLKLDELIRGVSGARTGLVDLEDLTDAELD